MSRCGSWHRGVLMVTHDAGCTWHYWSFTDSLESQYKATLTGTPQRHLIMQVTFESDTSGTMQVLNLEVPEGTPYLILTTADGGVTWQMVES